MNAQAFESLASQLNVADFQLMLVGDGSGTYFNLPCGWACASYFRPTGSIKRHFGGATGGTNNYAELAPFLHVLWVFHAAREKKYGNKNKPPVKILAVSDSEITVKCGNREYMRWANRALWFQLDWYVANGYHVVWKHVPRNSNPINVWADAQAGVIRQQMEDLDPGPLPA